MGLLAEDYLASFLGVRPAELVTIYRSVTTFCASIGRKTAPSTYLVRRTLNGISMPSVPSFAAKKPWATFSTLFGDSSDKERAMDVFARTAAIMDAVFSIGP